MQRVDITIIGAGVVGLACAYKLSETGRQILVVERNPMYGQETSSRNSEVIHAGIYYPIDSLKWELCVDGRNMLYDLCEKSGIACKKTGKIIVARDRDEVKQLNDIYRNAHECAVTSVRFLDSNEIRSMEPKVTAEASLWSPETGIIDTHGLMRHLHATAKNRQVNFAFSVAVTDIAWQEPSYVVTVKEPRGEAYSFESGMVVNCAGLMADTVAELLGMDVEACAYRQHYWKGQYFRLRSPKRFSISHCVYPPPSKMGLGIHLTPDLGGGVRVGPDARHVEGTDYTVEEEARDMFFEDVRRFLPSLTAEDLIPDTAGIRPKRTPTPGEFRDFVVQEEAKRGFPGFVNCIGIESPGLTSCLAIAEKVAACLSGKKS